MKRGTHITVEKWIAGKNQGVIEVEYIIFYVEWMNHISWETLLQNFAVEVLDGIGKYVDWNSIFLPQFNKEICLKKSMIQHLLNEQSTYSSLKSNQIAIK